jgi:hypothetical protein
MKTINKLKSAAALIGLLLLCTGVVPVDLNVVVPDFPAMKGEQEIVAAANSLTSGRQARIHELLKQLGGPAATPLKNRVAEGAIIHLLGAMRAREAVGPLLARITFVTGVPAYRYSEVVTWGGFPAENALVEIGEPSIGPDLSPVLRRAG